VADAVGFVVVGSGNIATTWVEVVRKTPGARLAGVVSRSGTLPSGLRELGVPVFTSLAGAAAAPRAAAEGAPGAAFDAAIVATPNGLHHEPIIETARLGRHVLTEKPLEISLEWADKAIAACRDAGVTLGVCFQRRTSPDNKAVKSLLDGGALGRVFAADVAVKFFREQSYYDSAPYRGGWAIDGGGAFMQQASHQVDLYRWFFGMPDSIKAISGTLAHTMEAEDHGAAILHHGNGMIGTIVASTVARPGFPARIEIHAEAGSVVIENDVISRWAVEGIPNPSHPPKGAIHAGSGAAGAKVSDTTGHEAILADFIEAIAQKRQPLISGEDARMTTELILKIYDAAGTRS
jgi:UDP-N-acetyl-2-amino-2-deoxyglucuronate dehydrogenase